MPRCGRRIEKGGYREGDYQRERVRERQGHFASSHSPLPLLCAPSRPPFHPRGLFSTGGSPCLGICTLPCCSLVGPASNRQKYFAISICEPFLRVKNNCDRHGHSESLVESIVLAAVLQTRFQHTRPRGRKQGGRSKHENTTACSCFIVLVNRSRASKNCFRLSSVETRGGEFICTGKGSGENGRNAGRISKALLFFFQCTLSLNGGAAFDFPRDRLLNIQSAAFRGLVFLSHSCTSAFPQRRNRPFLHRLHREAEKLFAFRLCLVLEETRTRKNPAPLGKRKRREYLAYVRNCPSPCASPPLCINLSSNVALAPEISGGSRRCFNSNLHAKNAGAANIDDDAAGNVDDEERALEPGGFSLRENESRYRFDRIGPSLFPTVRCGVATWFGVLAVNARKEKLQTELQGAGGGRSRRDFLSSFFVRSPGLSREADFNRYYRPWKLDPRGAEIITGEFCRRRCERGDRVPRRKL